MTASFPFAPGADRRVALGLEYRGDRFRGWQTQSEGRTVQDTLEEALARFLGRPVATVCAGRTDAGVHASAQVAHLDCAEAREESSWVRGLNSFLPDDVAVRWARQVDEGFHARFSARSRTYQYWLDNEPVRSPLLAGRTGWVWRPCAVEPMRAAAAALLGEHDFSSFRAADCQAASPVRVISAIDVRRHDRRLICVTIRANAFLQRMARNIVGALVWVGTGREPVGWLAEALAARDRAAAAPTFAPEGLYLTGVDYPDYPELPRSGPSPFDAPAEG